MGDSRSLNIGDFIRKTAKAYSNGISGAVGGMSSAIVACPFDVVKTRLQVQRHDIHYHGGIISTARTIVLEEGVRGFFTGLSPTLVGFVPTWMIYFSTYPNFKSFYGDFGLADGAGLHMLSAVSAGVVTDVLTNPIWVVKTRMQTQILRPNEAKYKNFMEAIQRLVREEGARGLYKGLAPQLVGLVHVGIQFPLYERMKKEIKLYNNTTELGYIGTMTAAFTAKIIASVVAYPHEILRSRLQFQHSNDPNRYKSMLDCISTIYREEGYRGYYKGLTANLLRVLPATSISFTVFETMSHKLKSL
jgi:solute carrier family 25 folate transporter 32